MDKEEDQLPMDAEPIVDQPKFIDAPKTDSLESTPERDEHGRFKAKEKGVEEQETAKPEPPSDKLPQDVYEPLKAIRSENQELKQQLAALQQKFEQQNATPPPSLFEDENGWAQHNNAQVLQQANTISRINASEMAARSQFPDFQEKFDKFNQMAQGNPALVQTALSDPHPWAKAYQIVKDSERLQGVNNIDELLQAERAKWEAELKAKAPSFPVSTAQDGSVAGRSGPVWSGPTPDNKLLPMG